MKLEKLHLRNYRNYEHLDLELNDGLTILTGENAQGKTNLLEAIFLLSLAKSHRTNHDQELIRWGQAEALIEASVVNRHFTFPLSLQLSAKGKIAKFNYVEQPKLSQFIGKLNVILFAPEDLQLIKGAPSLRRRFIDSELGQSHPVYLQNLLEYNRLLKQRNHYLKENAHRKAFDQLYFDILTEQLIAKAVEVIQNRQSFVEQLEELAQPIHQALSNGRDQLSIEYNSSSSKLNYAELDTLSEQLQTLFKNTFQRELDRGMTIYGPHRDDLTFYINDKNAQDYGSQGQQRSIILSLKLAEIEWLKKQLGEYPVLLLDDVLSELDDQRQHILMSHIEGKVQTFLTTATIDGLKIHKLQHASVLHVKNGHITPEKEGD